jgi:hypothetical protein
MQSVASFTGQPFYDGIVDEGLPGNSWFSHELEDRSDGLRLDVRNAVEIGLDERKSPAPIQQGHEADSANWIRRVILNPLLPSHAALINFSYCSETST